MNPEIDIGRPSRVFTPPTTVHAGPYMSVRVDYMEARQANPKHEGPESIGPHGVILMDSS